MNKKELNDFLDKMTVLNLDNIKLLRILTRVSLNKYALKELSIEVKNDNIIFNDIYSILPISDTNIKYDNNTIKLECDRYTTVITIEILDATKYELLTRNNIDSVYYSICEFITKRNIFDSRVSILYDYIVVENSYIKKHIPSSIKLEIRDNSKIINIGDYFNIEEEIYRLIEMGRNNE